MRLHGMTIPIPNQMIGFGGRKLNKLTYKLSGLMYLSFKRPSSVFQNMDGLEFNGPVNAIKGHVKSVSLPKQQTDNGLLAKEYAQVPVNLFQNILSNIILL